MVLDITPVPSIFPQSRADDDGFGTNIQERRKNEGSLGPSRMTLMHFAEGSTEALAPTYLNSFKFSKLDILKTEELIIVLNIDTSGNDNLFIRCADSKGSSDSADLIGDADSTIHLTLFQKPSDNTNMLMIGYDSRTTGVFPLSFDFSLTDEDVITTPWTISILGNNTVGGTLYWKIWIYRRGHGV